MHDRYAKTWYDTLTFTQKSTTYNPDGTTKIETWYEAALLPGKLRIDIGPPADGRAYLLVDGNATILPKRKRSKVASAGKSLAGAWIRRIQTTARSDAENRPGGEDRYCQVPRGNLGRPPGLRGGRPKKAT